MKRSMTLLLMLILPLIVQSRTWTAKNGSTLDAELKNYDAKTGTVVLLLKNGQEASFNKKRLSKEDQDFLKKWENSRRDQREQERLAAEQAKAGTIVDYRTDGENKLTYHCYYPKYYTGRTPTALLILFDPGGNGRAIMDRFRPVGDAHGWMIVGCDGLKNGMDAGVGIQWFEELLPHIESSIFHDPNKLYMGGLSGGAMRAYGYSADFDRPWQGIIACGGWLGGNSYDGQKYRKKMAVAMINGRSDDNANA